MHLRKITKEGRVNIPVEFLELFKLKENDFVEVTTNKKSILIKKHREANVCAVTGTVSKNLIKIGESYFSKEGIALIRQAIVESE